MGAEVAAPQQDDEHHDAARSGAAPDRSKSGTTHMTAAEAASGTWRGKHGEKRRGLTAQLLQRMFVHDTRDANKSFR